MKQCDGGNKAYIVIDSSNTKTRLLGIGFIAMFITTIGLALFTLMKPAEGAPSPGTCLPQSKGGTSCEPLPITLGGTGADTPLLARGNLGFNTICPTQTILTSMTDLQATISSLPKFLCSDVTINVTAGDATGDISIGRFNGPSRLTIQAIDGTGATVSTPNTQTHKANRFIIYDNTIQRLAITGFMATTTDAIGFQAYHNSGMVFLDYLTTIGGFAATTTNIGFQVYDSGGTYRIAAPTVSNKYQAFRVWRTSATIGVGIAGTGNDQVFRAENGGEMVLNVSPTIAGATLISLASGGRVTPPLPDTYSTAEQLTGQVWIDGKPIYRRVFTGTITAAANTEVSTVLALPTGYYGISWGGTMERGDNNMIVLPQTRTNQFGTNASASIVTGTLNTYTGFTRTNAPYQIWVEYTK